MKSTGKFLIKISLSLAALHSGGSIAKEKPRIFVSILPQSYLVNRIAKDAIETEVLVKPDQSPATYEPTPKQMLRLAQSQIFFSIGVPFEKSLLPKIKDNFKTLAIIPTDQGIIKRAMAANHAHHHDHSDKDPHIWLSPPLIEKIAKNIFIALCQHFPDQKLFFQNNYNLLLIDIAQTHQYLTEILEPHKGKSILVFHPAFGYILDQYHLKQEVIELEGKEPSPRHLTAVIKKAQSIGTKTIFVQPQFNSESVQSIAKAIGGKTRPLDPLKENLLDNLRQIGSSLSEALSNPENKR